MPVPPATPFPDNLASNDSVVLLPPSYQPTEGTKVAPKAKQDVLPSKYAQCLEQYTATLLAHYQNSPGAKRKMLERALADAQRHHQGQVRKNGGPYLLHPLRVALMTARAGMDIETAIVALLHDIIEDTKVTKQDIATNYGQWIANAIDGLTKARAKRKAYQGAPVETYRKLLTSTVADWCVLQVKLFDRLDNMRDLHALSRGKQIRISEETLNVYAPIAERLGMERIAKQLINLGFKHRYPLRWSKMQRTLSKNIWREKTKAHGIAENLRGILYEAGIHNVRIQALFQPLSDLLLAIKPPTKALVGFRLIVEENPQCYQAMGALQALFRVASNSIRDYISNPKPNHYRGLCSKVFIGGETMTLNYVSTGMHQVNTRGLLAQWKGDKEEINRYFNSHLELLDSIDSDQLRMEDVLRHAQMETLQVFSPKGHLFHFPRGSTVLDFAFAIHSDLGIHCIGGRIGRKTCSPFAPLNDGEVVEVLTHPNAFPEESWPNRVCTTKARLALKRHFKIRSQTQIQRIGREILSRHAKQVGLSHTGDIFQLPQLKAHLKQLNLNAQEVVEHLADGRIQAHTFLENSGAIPTSSRQSSGSGLETWAKKAIRKFNIRKRDELPLLDVIPGVAGQHTTAECCNPLPGDVIVAVQHQNALVLHHQNCHWLQALPSKKRLPAAWKNPPTTTPLEVRITLKYDGAGMIYRITRVCKLLGVNILRMRAEPQSNQPPVMQIRIPSQNLEILASMLKRLRKLPFVKQLRIIPTVSSALLLGDD